MVDATPQGGGPEDKAAALMLDRAIAAGTASAASLTAIGATLAQFYRTQPHLAFEPKQYVERIAAQIQTPSASVW